MLGLPLVVILPVISMAIPLVLAISLMTPQQRREVL